MSVNTKADNLSDIAKPFYEYMSSDILDNDNYHTIYSFYDMYVNIESTGRLNIFLRFSKLKFEREVEVLSIEEAQRKGIKEKPKQVKDFT